MDSEMGIINSCISDAKCYGNALTDMTREKVQGPSLVSRHRNVFGYCLCLSLRRWIDDIRHVLIHSIDGGVNLLQIWIKDQASRGNSRTCGLPPDSNEKR